MPSETSIRPLSRPPRAMPSVVTDVLPVFAGAALSAVAQMLTMASAASNTLSVSVSARIVKSDAACPIAGAAIGASGAAAVVVLDVASASVGKTGTGATSAGLIVGMAGVSMCS